MKRTRIVVLPFIIAVVALALYLSYWKLGSRQPMSDAQALKLVKERWGDCSTPEQWCRDMSSNVIKIEGAYFVVTKYTGLHDHEVSAMVSISPIVYSNGIPGIGERVRMSK